MTDGWQRSDGLVDTDPGQPDGTWPTPLGLVVEGSLGRGVEVRLDAGASVEDIKVGTFVTIQGSRNRFFGVVTDISLGSTDARLSHTPPQVDDPFIARVVEGTVAYGTISVLPTLTMPVALGDSQGPAAAKSIPAHFLPGLSGIPTGRGAGIWTGGPGALLDREPPGYGDQALPGPG